MMLVIGSEGQLGRRLVGKGASGVDFPDVDVTSILSVRRCLAVFKPEVVVNCAAMTDVDGCELDPAKANAVNFYGAANVADACRDAGARIIHISTDYVFGGIAVMPGLEHTIRYDEWQPMRTCNAYGQSKMLGEEAVRRHCPAHAVVRTAWLYSRDGMAGGRPTFVNGMASLLREEGEPVRVVDDQWGDPTDVGTVADAVCDIAAKGLPGTFHVTCSGGPASRLELATEIGRLVGGRRGVERCSTKDFPVRPGRRPSATGLAHKAADMYGISLPDWREALRTELSGV